MSGLTIEVMRTIERTYWVLVELVDHPGFTRELAGRVRRQRDELRETLDVLLWPENAPMSPELIQHVRRELGSTERGARSRIRTRRMFRRCDWCGQREPNESSTWTCDRCLERIPAARAANHPEHQPPERAA